MQVHGNGVEDRRSLNVGQAYVVVFLDGQKHCMRPKRSAWAQSVGSAIPKL